MSTARKAGNAAGALFLRKIWTSLTSLAVLGYLARTLEVEAFGVVAVCATLLSLIQVLAVSGISEYVVFFNGDEKEKKAVTNAAFWLNFFASLVVVLIGVVVAPLIGGKYDPIYGPVVLMMLGAFFSSMVASIPKALYRKEINYGPLVVLETIQQTLVLIGQVILAWQGFGVISLVLPTAIVSPIIAIVFLWKSPLVLTGNFGVNRWAAILCYTRYIIGSRLLTRLANEGDNLVIAGVLGSAALGVYHLAYRMANILFLSLMPVVADISMPVFARIAGESRRLFVRYIRMLSLIAFVMFPLLLLLFVNAKEVALLVYGKEEIGLHNENIGLLAQILMISVLGRCISSPTGGLFNATGKPHVSLWFVSVFTPLFLGILYFTSSFGLYAAAITVAAMFTVGQLVQTFLAARLVFDMPLSRVVSRVWPYALPAGLATAIALVSRIFIAMPHPVAQIIVISSIFSICYALLFRALAGKEIVRITRLLQSIHPRLGQAAGVMSWPVSNKLVSQGR